MKRAWNNESWRQRELGQKDERRKKKESSLGRARELGCMTNRCKVTQARVREQRLGSTLDNGNARDRLSVINDVSFFACNNMVPFTPPLRPTEVQWAATHARVLSLAKQRTASTGNPTPHMGSIDALLPGSNELSKVHWLVCPAPQGERLPTPLTDNLCRFHYPSANGGKGRVQHGVAHTLAVSPPAIAGHIGRLSLSCRPLARFNQAALRWLLHLE